VGRGPHPEDKGCFDEAFRQPLEHAVDDLCWLLQRGYGRKAALTLVGDRFQLRERQRMAVSRCACSELERDRRERRRRPLSQVDHLSIDGLNLLTTVEVALAGGLVLVARDGCYRDLASFHGNYRMVGQAPQAILAIGSLLGSRKARWLLDRPVSNTGRLAGLIRECAGQNGWDWEVELVDDPDRLLAHGQEVVATSDSGILDRASAWCHLARPVVDSLPGEVWKLDLSGGFCPRDA